MSAVFLSKVLTSGTIDVRFARNLEEIQGFQRVRHKVFCQEWGAFEGNKDKDMEADDYDEICDHLIAIDTSTGSVVGGYRLTRQASAMAKNGFVSQGEYDLSQLLTSGLTLTEVSRACVDLNYRPRGVMSLLWKYMFYYIKHSGTDILFGTVSFQGTDPSIYAEELSYLHYFHRIKTDYCPQALPPHNVILPLLDREALCPENIFSRLPPLAKGYIRLGGAFGQGAYIDYAFRSIDVCVVIDTRAMSKRYVSHYAVEKA